jgi:hypothetical protein
MFCTQNGTSSVIIAELTATPVALHKQPISHPVFLSMRTD